MVLQRESESFIAVCDIEDWAEVVANCDHLKFSLTRLYAFAKQAAIMAANVLNGENSETRLNLNLKPNSLSARLLEAVADHGLTIRVYDSRYTL